MPPRFLKQAAARAVETLWLISRDPVIRFAIAAALVNGALFNWPSFWAVEHRLGYDRVINSTLVSLAFFLLASLSRHAFPVLTVASFFLAALATYFSWRYQIKVSPDVWNVLFETNAEEASGFFTAGLAAWVLAATAAGAGLSWFFVKKVARTPRAPRIVVTAILVLAAARAAWVRNDASFGMPYAIAKSYVSYAGERRTFERLAKNRTDISAGELAGGDRDLTVVFIVGESARRDHVHANGYPRQTTPRLEALGARSYTNATSCAGITRFAVPCLFTRQSGTPAGGVITETSFISVLKRLGFATWWISNQGYLGQHETPVSVIAAEAGRVEYLNRTGNFDVLPVYDGALLPALDEALRDPRPARLVVLHTIGSHWNYDAHYPAQFARFTPPCAQPSMMGCPREHLFNSYDNTIAYTDHVIGEVIGRVRERDALVFYVSDHGELLGENDNYLHWITRDTPEVKNVAMFVWASDEYRRRHPAQAAAIAANAARPVVHHDLFHSVLDCADVRSPIIDTQRSICRPPGRRD